MFLLWILMGLAAAVLLAAYICYRMAFHAVRKEAPKTDAIEIPEGEIYEVFRTEMETWAREVRAMPRQEFSITAFDGTPLYGKFFEYKPGAPIELMFHGYRGSAERDLSGGVQRCFMLGRSALIVDQRCSGKSGGHVITFGVREHRDCLSWVDFAVEHFGSDVKLILTGLSMGASTMLYLADQELPENVKCIIADCGFTSPKAILDKGVTIEKVNGRTALFTIHPADGSYKVSFGKEEFEDYFKSFLRPQLVQMLF